MNVHPRIGSLLCRVGLATRKELRESTKAAHDRGWRDGRDTRNPRMRDGSTQGSSAPLRIAGAASKPFQEALNVRGAADPEAGLNAVTGPFGSVQRRWRETGQQALSQDLEAKDEHLAQERIDNLSVLHGLPYRLLKLCLDYAHGPKVTWQTEDEQAQEVIEEWWDSPINDLDRNGERMVWALMKDGAMAVPLTPKADGFLELGFIAKERFHTIISAAGNSLVDAYLVLKGDTDFMPTLRILNHQNLEGVRACLGPFGPQLRLVESLGDKLGHGAEKLRDLQEAAPNQPFEITAEDMTRAAIGQAAVDLDLNRKGGPEGRNVWVGDCLLFDINRLPNARFGKSLLLPELDMFDIHGDLLFQIGSRARLLAAVIYKLKCGKKTGDEINQLLKDMGLLKGDGTIPPLSGFNLLAMTDGIDLEVENANVGGEQFEELERAIRVNIIGAMGFPEHAVGFGGDTNFATALKQNSPMAKALASLQEKAVLNVYRRLLGTVCDHAVNHSRMAEDNRRDFQVLAAQIEADDQVEKVDALLKVDLIVERMVGRGDLSADEGKSIMRQEMQEATGVDLQDVDADDKAEADPDPPAGEDEEETIQEATRRVYREARIL